MSMITVWVENINNYPKKIWTNKNTEKCAKIREKI